MFRIIPLSIIRSFSLYTQQYITGFLTACEQDQGGTAVPSWSCSQAVSKPVWHNIAVCTVEKTPDDGQRNCPKHVEFYSKNKFEKLMHLVGFIIRIYHDALSPERQMCAFILGLHIHIRSGVGCLGVKVLNKRRRGQTAVQPDLSSFTVAAQTCAETDTGSQINTSYCDALTRSITLCAWYRSTCEDNVRPFVRL